MKIKIMKSFVTVEGTAFYPKQEIEIEDKRAKQFIADGFAKEIVIEDEVKIEKDVEISIQAEEKPKKRGQNKKEKAE